MSRSREYGYALVHFEIELPADEYDSVDEFKEAVLSAIGDDPQRGHYFGKVNFPERDEEADR